MPVTTFETVEQNYLVIVVKTIYISTTTKIQKRNY
jgi:hypothetical protein